MSRSQRNGRQLDYEERKRKRTAREAHKASHVAQTLHGHKAKLLHQRRYAEKVAMKKTIKAHEERDVKAKDASAMPEGALPTYLLDREGQNDAKALSSAVKQKRKEKAGKFAVPLPKVRGIAEDEMFKVIKTGKSKTKGWKRMVTKATFVGEVRAPVLSLRLDSIADAVSHRRTLPGNRPSWSASSARPRCGTRRRT